MSVPARFERTHKSKFPLSAEPTILPKMRVDRIARNTGSFGGELDLWFSPKRGEERFPPRKCSLQSF